MGEIDDGRVLRGLPHGPHRGLLDWHDGFPELNVLQEGGGNGCGTILMQGGGMAGSSNAGFL